MATRKFKLAKYIICAVGLASDSVGTVTIDGKIALIQPHAESNLYLCPLSPYPQPTYQQSWFFSDCLAYEHDIPAMVYPTPSELRQFKYRFIHYGPTKPQEISTATPGNDGRWATKTAIKRPLGADLVTRKFYMDHLLAILGETRELHHGPLTRDKSNNRGK